MKALRHLLLVAFLCLGQLASAAHAVEHALEHEDIGASHACEFCLQANVLGAALPVAGAWLLPAAAPVRPTTAIGIGRSALPPPAPSQRGPPHA
jgi:hypothetical protein